MRTSKLILLCTISSMVGLAHAPAMAQALQAQGANAEAVPGQPSREAGDETFANEGAIIVTAQKREQALVDVPLSISAISGQSLEVRQIKGITDLVSAVPSLSTVQTTNSSALNLVIRGQGPAAQERGVEQSVGVYVDGVYRSRPAMIIQDLVSVQRLEVLKGPQSTVFGRNNSAGAISIITAKPSFDPGGSFNLTYGNYNTVIAKATVTGPLIGDTVAFRISGSHRYRGDGILRNLQGTDGGQLERSLVRGELLFDISSQTKLRVIGEYSKIDDKCCNLVPLFLSDSDQAVYTSLGSTIPGIATAKRGTVNGISGVFLDPFQRTVYQGEPSRERLKDWGFSAQLDQDFDAFTLTAIGSYHNTDTKISYVADAIGTPFPVPIYSGLRSLPNSQYDEKQFEVRLASNGNHLINWLVGASYFGLDIKDTNSFPAFGINSIADSTSRALAAFGQVAVNLSDSFSVTVGGRYNDEDKSVVYSGFNPFAPLLTLPARLKIKDGKVLGDVAVSYKIAPGANLYARYARGYKSPGANLLPIGALTNVNNLAFKAEDVDAYEAGAKANIGRSLFVSMAVFYQKTHNQQVQTQDTATGVLRVDNAASARAYGVEAEFTATPLTGLNIGGAVSYLDSKWVDYANGSPLIVGGRGPQDLSGRPTLQSPKWSASGFARYAIPVGSEVALTPGIDFSYRSSYFTSTADDLVTANGSTFFLNASLELKFAKSGLRIQGWVKNLTKENIILSSSPFPLIIGKSVGVFVNEPRTYGMTLSVDF